MAPDPQYRSTSTHVPETIEVRQGDATDDSDRWMDIRLPIASTGEVRNEGDEPLTREELRGMADQINTNRLGVFPEHGQSDLIDFAGYSQFEKLGYWTDAEVKNEASADGEDMLFATARVLDPEPLPSQTGAYREALAILREQAAAGMPITTSIGWREDDDAPGGNDLLEVSIVGIAADPRTGTEGGQALIARAAVEAGADPDALVETVRAAVEGERPLGPPEDPERFDTFEECVDALAEDPDLSREDAEEICGAWEAAKDDQSHDMTETETQSADDADDTTAEEQTEQADDGEETETRAPDDVTPSDLAAVVAASYDGVETSDLVDAWDDMGDFTGSVDVDALASLVAVTTGADDDTVTAAMDDLMSEDQADDEDEEDEDDEEDEESDYDADGDDGREADDEDRAADADDGDDEPDLAKRLADLEDELAAVRSGEVEIATPDTDADDGADDAEQRSTDTETEETDDTDPADKPVWAQ